jgi:hypothetical protein
MFRFTIRDMLWLTVVAAVVMLWRVENARQDAYFRAMIDRKTSLKSDFDDMKKKAAPDQKLKAEVESLAHLHAKQQLQSVADRMALLRQFHDLQQKVNALPQPEPSLLDEWPPEPLPPSQHGKQ